MRASAGLILVTLGLTAYGAERRVSFDGHRLRVDGTPFFFYGCWGTPNRDFAEFKRRHFNTAFMSWSAAVKDGSKAAAQGLMVVPYAHAPLWNASMERAVASLVQQDWVLGWNIGDDLNTPAHLEAAVRVRDHIRALDPQNRPIMFDAIGLYGRFASIPDMWCAYAYPLVKPATASSPAYKPAGLREYGRWLDAMRRLGRPDGFFWTWLQCHVQIWYTKRFLGATEKDLWKPSRFPDGDHLRLLAGHAISSGVRGLMWFDYYYFQDDHYGRDRYARASVIGCELEVLGPLLAQGRVGPRLTTSDPTVWATPIDVPGGRLICLLKTGDLYHYQPDAARAEDVHVESGRSGPVYQIGYAIGARPQGRVSFDLTSWLLVADDPAVLDAVRRRHRGVAPDMARFAVEELRARLDKARPVFRALQTGGSALNEAARHLAAAKQRLADQDWPGAGRAAEAGLRTLRAAQHHAWRKAWTEQVVSAGLSMTDFYLLPHQAETLRLIAGNAWGPSRVANGDFGERGKWAGVPLGQVSSGKSGIESRAGRQGSRALHLHSDRPTLWHGDPVDWVTASAVSEKVTTRPGDTWEVAAWVRVPQSIQQTARGATLSLFVYDAAGKTIAGYVPDLEITQVEGTRGWKRLRLIVPARSEGAAWVAVRLSLCGVGDVFFDDVSLRWLKKSQDTSRAAPQAHE